MAWVFFKSISNFLKMCLQKNFTTKSPSQEEECGHNIRRVHCINSPEKSDWNSALKILYCFQICQALTAACTGTKINDKVKNI